MIRDFFARFGDITLTIFTSVCDTLADLIAAIPYDYDWNQ